MTKRLITVTQRLADVLERENDALRTMDFRRAAALLPEKTEAAADLQDFDSPVGRGDLALAAAARRLDGLALDNRRLLERAIAAQQRVIGIVVQAASMAAGEPSYQGNGRRARQRSPMALSTRA